MIKTVEWTREGVRMIDQRLLPTEEKYLILRSYEEVAEAIKKMVVRGRARDWSVGRAGFGARSKTVSRNFSC